MLTQYHIEIMLHALGARFSPRALSTIINANIYQDRIVGLFFHNEFHFDNNAFEKSYAFIESQRALTMSAMLANDVHSAWSAFGRMTHTLQDFYAHSNYITLWLNRFERQPPPSPPEIDPVDPRLIHSPDLHSGKTYYPFEYLYFHRKTRPLSLRILPNDSHAQMNLDSPHCVQGFAFDYAMQAAIKRTAIEYEITTLDFSEEMCQSFLDK